jgi:unsaturated rhamnogalacturonyl hydrolase
MSNEALSERAIELIQRVRTSWIARYRAQSQSTDWGQTLTMYGLLRSLSAQYDEATHEYLRTWVHFHMSERLHINYFCGSWSFGILYPEIIKWFPEVRMQLEETSERIYDFILHKALRNGDGVILHNVDLPNIYIDTVYYSAVPLAKLGTFLNQPWQEPAMSQIEAHLTILKDGIKPFYIHCEENASGLRSQGAWARGNGWVMMTAAELLPLMSNVGTSLLEKFTTLANAIAPLQTKEGLWGTILDETDSYPESSASAMYLFAFKRAHDLGLSIGNEDLLQRAFQGLAACIDNEGKVIQTSEGTWPGTVQYYKSLATGEWWWGTGATLLALSEFVIPHS